MQEGEGLPGPGQYSAMDTTGTGPAFSIKGRWKDASATGSGPGPGEYKLPQVRWQVPSKRSCRCLEAMPAIKTAAASRVPIALHRAPHWHL